MAESNERLVRAYLDAWESGDVDAIAACFADDFSTTYTDPAGTEVHVGPDDVHDWIAGWLAVVSDMDHEVHEIVADGDRAMAHVTYSATHTGELFGVDATGERLEIREFLSVRFDDGDIVELEWLGDNAGIMRQLGIDFSVEE